MVHRTTETDRFHSRVDATSVAVAQSRAAFEGWLRNTDAGESTVVELTVAFSELVANAVEASPGADQGIEAAAWTEDGSVVFSVANPIMPSAPPSTEPDFGDPLRTGGRGLLIVRAYTDTLEIEGDRETIAIRCQRRITD